MTTSEAKRHTGSCHCGAVKFAATLPLDNLITCNCSICGRSGAIMGFVANDQLEKIAGHEKLTDYQFGKKTIHHYFCSVCGARPYGDGVGPDGSKMAMINVRCLDGIDVNHVKVAQQYDGKSL